MSHYVKTYATREEWLSDRQSEAPTFALGSTDVCAILGVYFYGPWRVWMRAHRPDELPPVQVNDAMRVGTEWEPIVADWYRRHECARHGTTLETPLARAWSQDLPWLRVSPDGLVDNDGGVEIKVPRSRAGWDEPANFARMGRNVLNHVPGAYALQVNAMLLATGREWWDLVAFFSPHDVRVYRFWRDDRYLGWLRKALETWRDRFLLGGEQPEYDASKECRQSIVVRERDGHREATQEERAILLELQQAREAKKDAEMRWATGTARLAASMGDTKTITVPHMDERDGRATFGKTGRLTLSNL